LQCVKRSDFLLVIAVSWLPVFAGGQQGITVTSSSTTKYGVFVEGDLQGKATELSCLASIPSCSVPTPGEYSMMRASNNGPIYQDCTNVVLYQSVGKKPEKIGVYCWLGSGDSYISSSPPLRVEPVPVLISGTIGSPTPQESRPSGVRVPDAKSAISIAEPALIKTYGKRQIDYERPLTAKLDSGIWTVYGTLCCPDRNGHRTCEEGKCVGGVAVLKLRQSDGKILSIMHYK
jgi:hypothetical protein